MTVGKAVITVCGCVVLGWLIGGLLGSFIGAWSPELLSAILPRLAEGPSVWRVGVSLGLINGTWAGITIGLVIVALVAWFESRKQLETRKQENKST